MPRIFDNAVTAVLSTVSTHSARNAETCATDKDKEHKNKNKIRHKFMQYLVSSTSERALQATACVPGSSARGAKRAKYTLYKCSRDRSFLPDLRPRGRTYVGRKLPARGLRTVPRPGPASILADAIRASAARETRRNRRCTFRVNGKAGERRARTHGRRPRT